MTDKCPDGLLPDGKVCPRCGSTRAPSGIDGGKWVHFTETVRSASGSNTPSGSSYAREMLADPVRLSEVKAALRHAGFSIVADALDIAAATPSSEINAAPQQDSVHTSQPEAAAAVAAPCTDDKPVPDVCHVLAARAMWRRFRETSTDFDGDAQEAFIQIVAPILARSATRAQVIEECIAALDKYGIGSVIPYTAQRMTARMILRALADSPSNAGPASTGGEEWLTTKSIPGLIGWVIRTSSTALCCGSPTTAKSAAPKATSWMTDRANLHPTTYRCMEITVSPFERSRKVLEGVNVRKVLEESNLPVEIATAIADAMERPEGDARLRAALTFYANAEIYSGAGADSFSEAECDAGKMARDALTPQVIQEEKS